MGRKLKNFDATNLRRRHYVYEVKTKDIEQWEVETWIGLLETLLRTTSKVAEVLGVNRLTVTRWKEGSGPREWWRRNMFIGAYMNIRQAMKTHDERYKIIPADYYDGLAVRLQKSEEIYLSALESDGLLFKMISDHQPLSKRYQAIAFLIEYLDDCEKHLYEDIVKEADRHNLSPQVLSWASVVMDIVKHRKTKVINNRSTIVTHWWLESPLTIEQFDIYDPESEKGKIA